MATLRNKGAAPTIASDVATQGYVKSVRGTGSLTQTEINNQVSTALSPYADATYVATRDLLNATKSQIDAGDLGKLKVATINANSGVAGLDAGGRIQVARVPGNSTQRWPHGFYTPAAYHASTVASTAGNEAVMFTHTVADPGYPFRLLISGQFDVRTATNGDAPIVRVRVGSAGSVVATGTGSSLQYRYGVDTFDRTLSTLGAGWSSFYGGSGSGHTETNGVSAFWVPDGFDANRQGLCRKIADFATTVDDYQEVSYRVATPPDNEFLGTAPHNRLYGRVNTAINSYVAFDMTRTTCSLLYANGGNPVTLVAPQSNFTLNQGDGILAQFGVYAGTPNKRRFRLLLNGQVKLDYTDSSQVTAMSDQNRGWGFGQQAGSWLFNQLRPAALEWIALSDPVAPWSADPENYSSAVLTSTSPSIQASLVGPQILYVTLDATSTASVYATTTLPKLHVMAIPA